MRRRLKRWLSFLKRRWISPSCPKNPDEKLLVHIGCGQVNSPEFVNVDALPYAHVHVVTDNISELPQFADESVDLVYMCHIIEHIRKPQIKEVLCEMKRMLKPGGVLRLSVPDFDCLIEVYQAGGAELNVIFDQLMGGQDSEYNIHYSVFNRRSLSGMLAEVGFREVRPWDPWNCQYHDFKDKACRVMKAGGKSIAISLNLEAVK